MVCGRYPKESRHYESNLKKKCLKKFKNNVWENKTKWRLIEKAVYHYRIKILWKYFNLWTSYILDITNERINWNFAESHYNEKILSKGFSSLKKNVEFNWAFTKLCQKRFEGNLKVRAWRKWKHYTLKRLKIREIKFLANKIRKERLIIRFFYLWSFRYRERCCIQEYHMKAKKSRERMLKQRVFEAWKQFKGMQIYKKRIKNISTLFYEEKLTEMMFKVWKKFSSQRKLYKNQIKIINSFYEKQLISNYLNQLLGIYERYSMLKEKQKNNLAVVFYKRKIIEKCFRALENVRETNLWRKKQKEEFKRRYEFVCMSVFLKLWIDRKNEKLHSNYLEIKALNWRSDYLLDISIMRMRNRFREKLEEKERLESVTGYANAILLHKSFKQWMRAKDIRIYNRMEKENASEFYFRKLSGRVFEKWKIFVELKCKKRLADEHYRSVLSRRILYQWMGFWCERKMKLKKASFFEEKYYLKLVRKAFDAWREEVLTVRNQINMAVNYYRRNKLMKIFIVWKNVAKNISVHKTRFNQNLSIINDILIKHMILRWWEMQNTKKFLRHKVDGLKKCQNLRTIRLCFLSWYGFLNKMKEIRSKVDTFPTTFSLILLEQYIIKMAVELTAIRDYNIKKELAKQKQDMLLKRKILRRWIGFVCWKKEKLWRCFGKEKKCENSSESMELMNTSGKKPGRRKPLIPGYLKTVFGFDDSEESFELMTDGKTYNVREPVNKRLPVINHRGMYVSFDL